MLFRSGLLGAVDEHEHGQETLEVEPHVAFGGGLAAAVFGPVHAGGHQFDRGGIDDVDGGAETVEGTFGALGAGESGREGLEMPEHGPEELLGHFGVAVFSGMGKSVAARGRGTADGRERAAVEPEGVADIVEPDGVAELGIEHGDDMAPGREGAAEFIDAGVPGQLGDEVVGNEIAKLAKAAEFRG